MKGQKAGKCGMWERNQSEERSDIAVYGHSAWPKWAIYQDSTKRL